MDVPFNVDLPPVPDCFSKLLVNESDSSALPSQPWREAERLRELNHIMLKSLALESLPETHQDVSEDGDTSERNQVSWKTEPTDGEGHTESGETESENDPETCEGTMTKSNEVNKIASASFCRLNTALGRLKREMVDLRHLDMSLFCQLLSLNEAIQDFKMSVNDRYSEYTGSEYTCSEYAGSEYSFGGMGSRAGSFSSLNDDSDWGGDLRLQQEQPGSPVCAGDGADEVGRGNSDELAASTSSLLQQIKALTRRAETDF